MDKGEVMPCCHNLHLIMNLFYYACTDDYIQDRPGASSWTQCQIMLKMHRSESLKDSLTLDRHLVKAVM